jgi:uncharacterized protein YdhG (YjbR/CyaY superfamily)
MDTIPKTVGEYLRQLDKITGKTLAQVRKAVISSAPKAVEKIAYRIPYYSYNGALLAYMAHKNHCSFVTMSYDIVKKMKDELKPYKVSGTTIQFPHDKPLPSVLVKKIVKARLKENEAKTKAKAKKSN